MLTTTLLLFASALATPVAQDPVLDAPLMASDGSTTSLRDLAQGQPLAVITLKGTWCRVCVAELERISAHEAELAKMGVRVIALIQGTSAELADLQRRSAIKVPVLADPDSGLLRALSFWMPVRGQPLPGVFFIDPCGEQVGALRGRRPEVDHTPIVLKVLRQLSRRNHRCGPIA